MKNIQEIFYIFEKLGIYTGEDVLMFKRLECRCGETLLMSLRRYYEEVSGGEV